MLEVAKEILSSEHRNNFPAFIFTSMNQFNIRVYGILINNGALLVSDEYRFGKEMTKLPGGGLEWGEGLEEALIREWKEEVNIDISVEELVYINPFFQQSSFNPTDQVICVYFKVGVIQVDSIPVVEEKRAFQFNGEEEQYFRWVPLDKLDKSEFTYPIDQSLVAYL